MIELGHNLDLGVVADGVETEKRTRRRGLTQPP